ncbi:BatD family protein [Pseudoalteromonas sp. G4]|uniref:BatD family protein n=1 Tax=Pseudoalteromonas sp. G4 TaxID=2992761 RepID=UPI00237DB546|nr:BatD family protein [Pseudoalteromonas sp. G4]MDE3271716.1 BatD family protein [Pseudoalteromonas sp. G4]
MVSRIVVLICLVLLPLQAVAALSASVDRNPVLAGEFFNLTIRADQNVKGEQPDTSALLKDFVVGPTSVRSNTSIINGQVNHTTQWQVELMARNPGDYTIPSFAVANMQSSPITVKVVAASNADTQSKDVYIETSMENSELYVQQAGVYTVKLFLANDLTEGQLGSPELENANVSQLGKQKESYEIIDGIRYLIIERNYLIQPQKSGKYTIKSPYFKGRIRDNYRTRAASAIGRDVQLTIKPIPENISGNWLPSELVTLNEEWQPEKQSYQIGEPITRTITMTALGITKEQLPEINLPSINGVRSYSDQAETNNLVRNGKVISQKVESFALMPQTPGTHTLPEVRVPWFNVITNRIEYATLPTRELTVVGDPNFVQPTITAPQVSNAPTSDIKEDSITTRVETPIYYWPLVILGYALWLITLLIMWFKRKPVTTLAKTDKEYVPSANPLPALQTAVKENNQRAFYHQLVKMCKFHTGSADLTKLNNVINNPQFAEAINHLQANLYAGKNHTVDLKFIYQQLNNLNKKPKSENELTQLY